MIPRAKQASSLQAGIAMHRAGDLSGADAFFKKLIAREPGNALAWYFRGAVARERGDAKQALVRFERAAQLAPRNPGILCDLGDAYQRAGRTAEAVEALESSVALKPDHAEAHANLGLALRASGRFEQAARCFETALRLNPALADGGSLLLRALRESGDQARMREVCGALASCLPESVELCVELGIANVELMCFDEGVRWLRRAVETAPDSAGAHSSLAGALAGRGETTDALTHYRRALACDPLHAIAHGNLLFTLAYHPSTEAEDLRAEAERYQRSQLSRVQQDSSHANDRSAQRRLRVGYVSGDFRFHAAAMFLVPLLRAHDRGQVEIFCYSNVSRADAVTDQMRSLADHWREIAALDDAAAARVIGQDGIDVLVDLSMHTDRNRPFLFARKPAPVQTTWLAYAGTTGIAAIDYRITDVHFDPPGCHDEHYTERCVRLPETFWCYDPLTEGLRVSSLPALERGYVTFGCLNTYRKASDAALALWASVIVRVPDSRLLMVAPEGMARSRALGVLGGHGVASERVAFVDGTLPRQSYLELYHGLDVCLDAFPFQGGTTSLDAFWMGVPVVSRVGRTSVSRACLTITRNLGLAELACATDEEFVDRACVLSADLPALAALRSGLRDRMESSPLMDAPRFAGHLETAFRAMWREWSTRA